uniref:Uncharacterized protein n=1 Tax=Salix viminalis TaxID=40686 RepID=A0A6N2KRN6_SALVM
MVEEKGQPGACGE